jgi:hypothetical protein
LRADIEERADIRMLQSGDGARFAFKALASIGGISQMLRQNLYGDGAIEARVACAIDFSHAASAERRDYFVGAEASARS